MGWEEVGHKGFCDTSGLLLDHLNPEGTWKEAFTWRQGELCKEKRIMALGGGMQSVNHSPSEREAGKQLIPFGSPAEAFHSLEPIGNPKDKEACESTLVEGQNRIGSGDHRKCK